MPAKKPDQSRRTVRRSSLRTTLFFESFSLLALTVLCVSFVAFFLSWHELKIQTTSTLEALAEEKEALLEQVIAEQREELSRLGQDPDRTNIAAIATREGFRQLLDVDNTGNVTVLAGERDPLPLTEEVVTSLEKSAGTVFRPIVTAAGWTHYVIATAETVSSDRTGRLVAIFDAAPTASRIMQTDTALKSTEILLVTALNRETTLLHRDNVTGNIVSVLSHAGDEPIFVRDALRGDEGTANTLDYAGIPVLAASRSIPSLGWAIIAKVDLYEVREPTLRLAMNLVGTGLMIIVFLSLSTFFMGRRIVGPLEELTRKLDGLETKEWKFARSIFTGNEIEVVDSAADALTKRLRKSHEHLESLVDERTKELRKEYAEDLAILETMDDGLVVTDEKGRITYVNRMAEALMGNDGALSARVTDVLVILDASKNVLHGTQHPVLRVLGAGVAFKPTEDPGFMLRKPGGEETALQIRITPIMEAGTCTGSVAVIRDVSQERHIDHLKSEFISLVSHQLRTPLSSMRWYLEMLLSNDFGELNANQREYVAQVATSNTRMVHLVNALLNVSRIELGKLHVSTESIDMCKLVRGVASSFELESKQKNITPVLNLPEKSVGIRSDKNLLELILDNLLSNAIKYSANDSTIDVGVSTDPPSGTATVTIRDTGIGIPAVQKQEVGKKLFRCSNAKKSDTDGNGLGLYISYIAAETIGATLSFESVENEGTTFSLRVPLDPKGT